MNRTLRHGGALTSLAAALALGMYVLPASGDAPGVEVVQAERIVQADRIEQAQAGVAGVPDPVVRAVAEAHVAVRSPGQVFPSAPDALPRPADAPTPTVEDIRRHMRAADPDAALRAAEAFVAERRWGRERDAAWLLVGLLHREAGRHNAASEAFTRVRLADGPLAPLGAYHEAEQDLARGKPWVAVRECEAYRERWPRGEHAHACLRVIAQAHARLGNVDQALEAAATFDAEVPNGPITEQISLALATTEARTAPDRAVHRLRELAVEHTAPLTGRVAVELLEELAARGVEGAAVPDDTASLQRRARSMRDAGNRHEAFALFQELIRRADDDPALRRWVEAETPAFGYRTRHWDFLADHYRARYDARPNGDDLWSLHKVLGRGGRWDDAAEVARLGMEQHGRTRRWRYNEEVLGRTFLLSGDYAEARDVFDARARRGGWTGRRCAYFAAFSAFMAGDLDDAEARFRRILDRDRSYVTGSRYWLARTLEAKDAAADADDTADADTTAEAASADVTGEHATADADADDVTATDATGDADDVAATDTGESPHAAEIAALRAQLVEDDPHSWYAVLLAQGAPVPPDLARDGTWHAAPLPEPAPPPAPVATGAIPLAVPTAPASRLAGAAFGRLTWPLLSAAVPEPPPAPAPSAAADDPTRPPASYRSGPLFDEDRARASLRDVAARFADDFPELERVHDLSSVGLFDLSGPMMAALFADVRQAMRSRYHPRHDAARELWMRPDGWRDLFLVARDHHNTARFVDGLAERIDDPVQAREALALGWPLAHDRFVWQHARDNDVDPYLVLGLMRQESVYNAIARSRVGASGAMQIMPRTGHLLADLAHDTGFTAADLEDPIFSIGYGLEYLGLLLERFDGVYPLAVASYNGGPHNVSSWLAGTGHDMPIDAFVEHIPFRETRQYVQKVSAGYATYLDLYAPEGSRVALPPHARGDHPDVVDF